MIYNRHIPKDVCQTADVFIMLEQLVHIYGIDKEVQKQAEYKVNCVKERLKEK